MNWFVGDSFRLLYNCDPTSRFDGTERIKIPVSLEMPALTLANFIDQDSPLGGGRGGVWLEIAGKKCGAVLIEDSEKEPIGKLDRR